MADSRPFPDQRGEGVDEPVATQPPGAGHQPRQFRGGASSQPTVQQGDSEAVQVARIRVLPHRSDQGMPLLGAQSPEQRSDLIQAQPVAIIDQHRAQSLELERKNLRFRELRCRRHPPRRVQGQFRDVQFRQQFAERHGRRAGRVLGGSPAFRETQFPQERNQSLGLLGGQVGRQGLGHVGAQPCLRHGGGLGV